MTPPVRSWLYVPGTRPDLVAKAVASDADAVVIDLEDAVPPAMKDSARASVVVALAEVRHKPLWVRMNPLDSPWGLDDARALAGAQPDGVRVPKCSDTSDVKRVADLVGCPVSLLLESAVGIERAYDLAVADPRVAAISLGEADLMADLRLRRHEGLAGARMRVVLAARAAGLPSPVQSVYTAINDIVGLRDSTMSGRDLGFFGRSVIHPKQVGVVNDVFTPDAAEVKAAREVLQLMSKAIDEGRATGVDAAGRFIDPAVAEQAAWVLRVSTSVDRHRNHQYDEPQEKS